MKEVKSVARPRKLLKNCTGNLTVAQRTQKAAEEEVISGWNRDLLDEIPPELRDRYAKETWQRILPDLLAESSTCNLDRDNLVCYCNAWSQYLESCRKLKRNKKDEDYQSLWLSRQRFAMAEQRRYGKLCGMDASSRLKNAELKLKEEDEELEAAFGAF